MRKLAILSFFPLFVLSCNAQDIPILTFQEPTPLLMKAPNEGKGHQERWLAISTDPQEAPQKSPLSSVKTIDESIKVQIQKRIQTFLKPLENEDEN